MNQTGVTQFFLGDKAFVKHDRSLKAHVSRLNDRRDEWRLQRRMNRTNGAIVFIPQKYLIAIQPRPIMPLSLCYRFLPPPNYLKIILKTIFVNAKVHIESFISYLCVYFDQLIEVRIALRLRNSEIMTTIVVNARERFIIETSLSPPLFLTNTPSERTLSPSVVDFLQNFLAQSRVKAYDFVRVFAKLLPQNYQPQRMETRNCITREL